MKTKNILRTLLASAFIMGTTTMNAQSTIYVHKKGGESVSYNVTDLDSISFNPLATADVDYTKLKINEVNGKSGEKWFEIYNTGNVDINLAGVKAYYSNKATPTYNLTWTGGDVTILAGGFYTTKGSELETGLSANNEFVRLQLRDPQDAELDTYEKLTDINDGYDAIKDKSHQRIPDGGAWYYTDATGTPGTTNAALTAVFVQFGNEASAADEPIVVDPTVDYTKLIVNEVFADGTKDATDPDWVEIYNSGAVAIDLDGCFIQDVEGKASAKRVIAAGITVPAGGYVKIWTEQNHAQTVTSTGDFGLSTSESDGVSLFAPDETKINRLEYPAPSAGQPKAGKSWGRYNSGQGWMNPTPAAANTASTAN